MRIQNKYLLIGIVSVASVAMVCMLTYNFFHTGELLASYMRWEIVGYIAAFGIELGVVGLSVAIGTRKWHGMKTGWLAGVLGAVLFVSFLANISQGHVQRYGTDITRQTVTGIDLIQGIIGLAATGLISVIAMAMSEIIGQYLVQLATQEEEVHEETAAPFFVELAPTGNGHRKKVDIARALLERHPEWTNAEVARAVPCDPSTVSKARKPTS